MSKKVTNISDHPGASGRQQAKGGTGAERRTSTTGGAVMNTTSNEELAKIYSDYLKREGYLPETEGNGMLRFKREGLIFLIVADGGDPEYFRLVLPNFWQASDEATRREALSAINETTQAIKVANVVVDDDGRASVYVELFITDAESATKLIQRCMDAASQAARIFLDKLRD